MVFCVELELDALFKRVDYNVEEVSSKYGVISVSKFEIPDASVRNFMQAVKTSCKRSKTLCKRSKLHASGQKLYASGQNFLQAVKNFMQGVQTSCKRSKTGVPKT